MASCSRTTSPKPPDLHPKLSKTETPTRSSTSPETNAPTPFSMRFMALLAAVVSAAAQNPISTAFQLSEIGTWFENIAVRSDGSLLATRMDVPEIWQIDPATNTGDVLVTVPSTLSTTGITELTPDVFVFAVSNFSFVDGPTPGSLAVWKVDLNAGEGSDEGGVEPEFVASFPEAEFLNGMATWDEKRVLVGDTMVNVVYLLDVETGEFEVALDGPEVSGVNGIRVHEGDIYTVSNTENLLYRIPVDADARITGEAEVVSEALGFDDFDFGPDGAIYAANMSGNAVVKILDGEITTIAGGEGSREVLGPSSVRMGRGEGEGTIYVSTTGNGASPPPGTVGEPASVVAVSLAVGGNGGRGGGGKAGKCRMRR